ncbi:MAG: DUF86 domain-containing protein [Nanoarchaeota archaeon]
MQRRYELYIKDILEQINVIKEFTESFSFEEFKNDKKTIYAVTRALEIIGEAASNIPEEIRKKYNEIPWQVIRKFRNVIVHKYWGVEIDVEWDIIKEKLDILEKQIKEILEKEED